jgi:ribose/xylose/arabinose/galactoside ABC-type transport system permease subunit
MAYDDSSYRRRDPDSSLRDDTAYRPTSYESGDYPEPDTTESTLNGQQRRLSPAVLDDVFDDPEHGEVGRDRMAVHLVWETVLLLAAAAFAVLLYRRDADAFRGASLNSLLVFAAALGLLGLGAAVTLRTGAVNLALGPVAVASALHFAEQSDRGVLAAAGVAVAVGAAAGLVIAVSVVGLHVPGWAASLAAGLAVVVYIQQRGAPVEVQGGYDPTRHAAYLFGMVAALSVLGGLLGSIRSIRRTVGRFRPVGDPARRRGGVAGVLTGGAIVLSTVCAVGAGVLLAAVGDGPVVPSPGLELTGLALGAALAGGTSAFGRRGGVFGTVLAVTVLTLFIRYAEESGWRIAQLATAATAMAIGLVVTRLVERFGRPPARPDDDWDDAPAGLDPGPSTRSSPRTESWSSALPAQPAAGRADPWESDRWRPSGR